MKIIRLTGGIGSGKSVVASFFGEFGAKVIDADRIAHELLKPQSEAWKAIVEHFGNFVLNEDGTINRKRLGNIVFNDPEELQFLNKIMHPAISKRIQELINFYKSTGAPYIVIDAPLVLEAGKGSPDNPIVVVICNDELRIQRVMERDSISRDEVVRRIQSQMPQEEKAKLADYIIDNSGSLEETKKRAWEVWKKITSDPA